MKTAIKISKNSISLKNAGIDLREYEEEIADFMAGLKAHIILVSDEFVPWEKVKKELQRKKSKTKK
jgi:hypothetical protein